MSRIYKLKDEQNIIDLAIQETGSVTGIFDIIDDNSGVDNLNHLFEANVEVVLRDEPRDKTIKDFFKNKPKLFVSTGDETIQGDFNNDFNNDFYNRES